MLALAAGSARAEDASRQSLTEAANDPTAPLAQLNLKGIYLPPPGRDIGSSNGVYPQLVVPTAASDWIPFDTITRLGVPYVAAPSPEHTAGMGDTQLIVIGVGSLPGGKARWGLGGGAVFPTAGSDLLGQGKWQLGVSAALIATHVPDWQLGFVAADFFSVGGSPSRENVHALQISPTVTHTSESGWFWGLGDFNWTVDWENSDVTLPVSLQVGRVFTIGKQAISLSCEGGVLAIHPDDTPQPSWIAAAELTFLFPEVIRQRRFGRTRPSAR